MKKRTNFIPLAGLLLTLLLGTCQTTFASVSTNDNSLWSYQVQNSSVKEVLDYIVKNSGYVVIYPGAKIDLDRTVNVNVKNQPVENILNQVFEGTDIDYTIRDRQIILHRRNEQESKTQSRGIEVSGTVVDDSNGEPLVGAAVVVESDKTKYAVTDKNGNYTIENINPGEVMEFTYLGYMTRKIASDGRAELDVRMTTLPTSIDETIVVAYGTAKRGSYTGSASVVKSEVIAANPTTSVVKSLQASAPGVYVVTSSGAAGADPQILIRGTGSITASSSPLYVVDGIISSTMPNTTDIENISVLKDAASASLYGSRAGNGVVMITTKQGREGKPRFTYRGEQGFSTRTNNRFKVLNSEQFMQISWEGLYNYASDNGGDYQGYGSPAAYANAMLFKVAGTNPFNSDEPFDDNGNLKSGVKVMLDQDWFKEVYRTGLTARHTFDVSGGTDRTKYYLSATYFKQTGIVKPDNMSEVMGRVNLSTKVSNAVTIGYNSIMKYSKGRTESGMNPATYVTPSEVPATFPNNVSKYILDSDFNPVLDAYGNPQYNLENLTFYNGYNPIDNIENDQSGYRNSSFTNTLTFNLKLAPGLVFDTKANALVRNGNSFVFLLPTSGAGMQKHGYTSKSSNETLNLFSTSTLTYEKTCDKFHFNALAGFESENDTYKSLSITASKIDVPLSDEISLGTQVDSYSSSTAENRMLSVFSGLNADYASKYYVSCSVRRDGSTRFGTDNRWGTFWSASAAWRITNEEFLKDQNWLNELKLRASYGTNGNCNIPNYQYLALYSLGLKYNGHMGARHSRLANNSLGWEKNAIINVGADFMLFNRISGSIEWYDRQSKDLLMNMPLPISSGFTSVMDNVGAVKNTGVELDLHSTNVNTKDFTWTTDFNFSTVKNTITALTQDKIYDSSSEKLWRVGHSLYQWYGYEFTGVDPQTGLLTWSVDQVDENGNVTGKTTTTNMKEATPRDLGCSMPNAYGSLTNSLTYKRFTFSFQFYFSLGGQIMNLPYFFTSDNGSNYGGQLNSAWLRRWKKAGDVTDMPRYVYQNPQSAYGSYMTSQYLQDASFLRLRTLSLSYALPSAWVNKIGLDGMSIYVNGDNLWVLSKFDGMDPEQGIDGEQDFGVPNSRTLTLGLTFNF